MSDFSKKMRRVGRLIIGLMMAGLAVLSASCASGLQAAAASPFNLAIAASASLNADANGRPSPLRIVLYELKSVATFESIDFFSLSQKDQAMLGAEALGKEEVFMKPGETKMIRRKGNPDAAFIGVFAEFRDIDKAVWRATVALPATERQGMLTAGLALLKSDPPTKTYQIYLDQKMVRIQP